MAIEFITNNHERPIVYGYELTAKQLEPFDYVTDVMNHEFVIYRGAVIDISEFDYVRGGYINLGFSKWDGVMSDSFFSGMVIKQTDDYSVIIGRYYVKD